MLSGEPCHFWQDGITSFHLFPNRLSCFAWYPTPTFGYLMMLSFSIETIVMIQIMKVFNIHILIWISTSLIDISVFQSLITFYPTLLIIDASSSHHPRASGLLLPMKASRSTFMATLRHPIKQLQLPPTYNRDQRCFTESGNRLQWIMILVGSLP
jgi:hypothetical protein